MKAAWLLLVTLAVSARGSIHSTRLHHQSADEGWIEKQTKVIQLLAWGKTKEPFENEYYNWDIENQAEYFDDKQAYYNFLKHYRHDFLPKDASYSWFSPLARNQTISLFEFFYSAKDFNTFYKAASWARGHVHYMSFAYAFSIAVFQRPDCKGLEIPPFYELVPNYFVHSQVLHNAYKAKMYGYNSWKQQLNYTGYDYNYHKGVYGGVLKNWAEGYKHEENRLSYFREDVALNDFYARWFLHWPQWFNTTKYHQKEWRHRGELFYYFHQQLYARYNLERFANGLPAAEFLHWEKPIKTGYNPDLYSWKGIPLFTRPDYYNLKHHYPYGVWKAHSIERKLFDIIDANVYLANNQSYGSFKGREGTDLLGRAFAGMPKGAHQHFYGNWFFNALQTLAYSVKTNTDKHFVGGPTAYMLTALRDPAYYQILHRMIKFFQTYKEQFHYYKTEELFYPGVKIESFDVDKLLTYFDDFEFDITYGLGFGKDEHKADYHYIAKQPRINHKPFNYKLSIASERSEDAMVRIFAGPKYDSNGRELTIEQARMAYFEMDRFPVKLTAGQNVIERSSRDSSVFVKDFTSTRNFKEYISKYTKSYPEYQEGYHCGFPENFQLPKGKKGGYPLVFFAIVTPWEHKQHSEHEEKYFQAFVPCGGYKYYDYKPFGYPFDRPVPYEEEFYTPNMYFKTAQVYHKDDKDFAHRAE